MTVFSCNVKECTWVECFDSKECGDRMSLIDYLGDELV